MKVLRKLVNIAVKHFFAKNYIHNFLRQKKSFQKNIKWTKSSINFTEYFVNAKHDMIFFGFRSRFTTGFETQFLLLKRNVSYFEYCPSSSSDSTSISRSSSLMFRQSLWSKTEKNNCQNCLLPIHAKLSHSVTLLLWWKKRWRTIRLWVAFAAKFVQETPKYLQYLFSKSGNYFLNVPFVLLGHYRSHQKQRVLKFWFDITHP